MDPQDLFSQLFGGGGGGGGGFFGGFGGGGGRSTGPRRGKDLVHRVNVTLEDLYKGKMTKLALTRHVICSKCNGKGGKEGAVKSCTTCNGRGVRVTLRQMGPMLQQIQQPCSDCDGTGEQIDPKNKCKVCNGKKVVSERKFLDVHIDKGMKGGQTITFSGESDQSPDVIPGDVVIVVEEKPHDRFTRDGDNLKTDVDIDLLTALAGGPIVIKHLDDRALLVDIVPGTPIREGGSSRSHSSVSRLRISCSGDFKVIRDQGMPSLRHHEPGDLFVKFHVKFPDHLDPSTVNKLEKALPPRKPLDKFPKSVIIEDAELLDLDARQQREQANRGDDAMDEDDEQPRVQCANQ